MNPILRRLWRLSWVVTLPIAVVFFVWAGRTHHRFTEFGLRQITGDRLNLLRSGQLEFDHMVEQLKVESNALGVADRLAETGLRTISLYVSEGKLQQLNSSLPVSGGQYVKGGMAAGGEAVQEVDVRYRGDSVYHWAYWKKSWRVKTKKDQLFLGMRKFNLIATRTPNLLNNHLAYRLASHMGLISPYSEVVNVVLNGELLGVHILTEQLDESTIRRHGRMPGDVYSGDIAGLDRFIGHSGRIFDQPGAWTKVAVNNHFDEAALDPLREFLFLLRHADRPEAQAGLSEILDVEAMGRSTAFDVLSQTIHSDNAHNWRFYYDPWKTKMTPIVWDPMGWMEPNYRGASRKMRPDILVSDLHSALLTNPDFLRARHAALTDFFRSGADKLFVAEARDLVHRMTLAIEADPNFVFRGRLLKRELVIQETEYLVEYIQFVFDEIRRVHLGDPGATSEFSRLDAETIRLNISGRRPLVDLELVYDRPLRGPLDASITCLGSAGEERADVSGAAMVSGATVRLATNLMARPARVGEYVGPNAELKLEVATYDIRIKTPTEGARLVHVQARRGLGGTMQLVEEANRLSRKSLKPMVNVVHPEPIPNTTIYSADVVITGDRVLESDLRIEAGTRLLFEPGANLLVKGRVLALGTKEEPIEFRPRTEGQEPWGVFAIKGPAADGSRFKHCHFREGSGWKQPLAEYSAMFSIHHVQGVRVEHCLFEDSRIVDDMVHGVYSDVKFHDCKFVRSLFDALDMDISSVEVLRCEFIESGNDSVDLMTARATVDQTKFLRSGDKGISVGEDSLVLTRDTLFDSCFIAVQTKDESTATLINCDLVNCKTGVDGLKKNWRYDGGGEAFIYKTHISGSERSLSTDSHSRLVVRDCFVHDIEAIKRKRIDMDETVDSASPRKAATSKLVRHPDDLDAMGRHGADHPIQAFLKTRGSRFRSKVAKTAGTDL